MKSPKARSSSRLPFWIFGIFTIVFLSQTLPGLWSNSLTNDEPVEITNGYYALTRGDLAGAHHYGPAATVLNALPLLLLPLKSQPFSGDVLDRAHSFLFEWNRDRLAQITVAARIPGLLLGLSVGWLLFRLTRKEAVVSLAAMALWAFHPAFLGHTGLAKSDMPACFFLFVSVLAFQMSLEGKSWGLGAIAGMTSALAVTSKFSCLILIPIFLALEALGRRGRDPSLVRRWAFGLGGFLGTLFLVYLPASFASTEWRWPHALFLEKLGNSRDSTKGHFRFIFWGRGDSKTTGFIFQPSSF